MKNRSIKKLQLATFIFTLSLFGCEKIEIEKDVPECIEEQIRAFSKSKLTCDTGAKVNEYTFQDETVYVFDPGICITDQSSEVIDAACNSLGSVWGWSGVMIKGQDFSNAAFIRTVWKN